MSNLNIAIDGPSGAGKSTIAKAAAKELGFLYVDTGAMYRAIALFAYRNGITKENKLDVISLLPRLNIQLKYIDRLQHVFLNGEDVSEQIRQHHISMLTSEISSIPEVRSFLLDLQRDIAEKNNLIMDGRDIGTVILPNAQVKIFLTASEEARAMRRFLELKEKGENIEYDKVLEDVRNRDINDTQRAAAPLKMAEAAVFIDTTEKSLEQSIEAVTSIIKERISNVI